MRASVYAVHTARHIPTHIHSVGCLKAPRVKTYSPSISTKANPKLPEARKGIFLAVRRAGQPIETRRLALPARRPMHVIRERERLPDGRAAPHNKRETS